MDSTANESSLDRFLKQRGASGLGLYGKRVVWMQGIMGGLMTTLGLGALLPFTGVPPEAASGFLFGGAMCLAISQIMRVRLQPLMSVSNWKLTPEAKGLLLKLVQERLHWSGFGIGPMRGRHARIAMRRVARNSGDTSFNFFGYSSSKTNPEVVEMLEGACTQFNRIQGILESPAGAGLTKVSATAAKAAEEAMATILDNGATMDRYPESGATTRQQVFREIKLLTELGDRLEDLTTRQDALSSVSTNTAMDNVLEELRLEQMARSELQTSSQDSESQSAR